MTLENLVKIEGAMSENILQRPLNATILGGYLGQ